MDLTFKDFLEGCWSAPADSQNLSCKVSSKTYQEANTLSKGKWTSSLPKGIEVAVDDSVPDGKVKVLYASGEYIFQWDKVNG
jgi:hypothetical protein